MVSRNFSLKQLSISPCSEECFLQSVELERTDKARGERQSWHVGILLFLLFCAIQLLQILSLSIFYLRLLSCSLLSISVIRRVPAKVPLSVTIVQGWINQNFNFYVEVLPPGSLSESKKFQLGTLGSTSLLRKK